MAKIFFEKNDRIFFAGGFGIVLDNNQALMIKGPGGRIPRVIEKGKIPEDAMPVTDQVMPFEVSFALQAVEAVMS